MIKNKPVLSLSATIFIFLFSFLLLMPSTAFAPPGTTNLGLPSFELVFEGNLLAFNVPESQVGADLNSDGDTNDNILHVFDATTLTAEQLVQAIKDAIMLIGLPKGMETSLLAPLGTIPDLLNDMNTNNDVAACGKLDAFINNVNSMEGKQLDGTEADTLRNIATDIKSFIGCT